MVIFVTALVGKIHNMLPSSDPATQKPCLPIDKFIIGPTTLGGYRRSITIRYFVVIICLRFDYRKSQNRKQGREISDRWDLSRTPSRGRPRRLLSTPTVINIANREARQPFPRADIFVISKESRKLCSTASIDKVYVLINYFNKCSQVFLKRLSPPTTSNWWPRRESFLCRRWKR